MDREKIEELKTLRVILKSGEYDGVHLMKAWLAIDDLVRIEELLKTHTLVPKDPVGEVQAMIRVDWENTDNTKVIALIDKDKKLAPGTKLYAAKEGS